MIVLNFTPRIYQQSIAHSCIQHNCLIVLPTGLGKTNIFLMVALNRLQNYPSSKVLLLGPTKPLIDQYFVAFQKNAGIAEERMVVFTGDMPPEKRARFWQEKQIIFSTPQCIENDVLAGKITLADVSLLGFDEAHRASGNYSYVWLAKNYNQTARFPRIVGMTASPGSEEETIMQVCSSLFIEEIAVRTEDDPDVKPYLQDVEVQYCRVDFPKAFIEIRENLQRCSEEKLSEVKQLGFLNSTNVTKMVILQLQAQLHARLAQGEKDFSLMKSISVLAEALKVQHALELLETQSLFSMLTYMEKLQQEAVTTKVKAVQRLVQDVFFKTALQQARMLHEQHVVHPKMPVVLERIRAELSANPEAKIMLFTQFRDTGTQITNALIAEHISAQLFVGQAKKNGTGLQQKQQQAMLDAFSGGTFSVLVSSSVGEEGLDIPAVDIVMFYEPIPSVIRKIQRSGRTGRLRGGKVIVFMTKHTRDEAYHYVARNKERRMYAVIDRLKKNLVLNKPTQTARKEAAATNLPVIVVDYREKNSAVVKALHDSANVTIEMRQLDQGDYLISDDIIVEYKRIPDFVDSIVDGRLLEQLRQLKSFAKPILLLEGTEDVYSCRRIHPNAINGMLAMIATGYAFPILWAKNEHEAAGLLLALAKREHSTEKRPFSFHANKPLSRKEQQEFIVSSLPGIGSTLAKPLLEKFGSVSSVLSASKEALQDVPLVGEKKAKLIRDVLEEEYKKEKDS
ncbi:MAG: DEAD/DEAH box helicase [archaeon]